MDDKIKNERIPNDDGTSYYTVQRVDDFENVQPRELFWKIAFNTAFHSTISILKLNGFSEEQAMNPAKNEATKFAEESIKLLDSTIVPQCLINLLGSNKKRDQEKLLKNLTLENTELVSFILVACEKYEFTFSQYRSEHRPTGMDKEIYPKLIHKENASTIHSVGQTTLSAGQMKVAVDDRKVGVAKFLDKGDEWHCFFLTYRSLSGKETKETPHLHYISSSFGIPRKEVVQELKSKRYSLPSTPHINFITNRNRKSGSDAEY